MEQTRCADPRASTAAVLSGFDTQLIVASDYLVNFDTNRYLVPFSRTGQAVELERHSWQIVIFHRDPPVAEHALDVGKRRLVVHPEQARAPMPAGGT